MRAWGLQRGKNLNAYGWREEQQEKRNSLNSRSLPAEDESFPFPGCSDCNVVDAFSGCCGD